MKNYEELKDAEVLCIYDLRAIQKFIFSHDSDKSVVGAGMIVPKILNECLREISENLVGLTESEYSLDASVDASIDFLDDPKVKMQLLTCGGGNAFVLFRTGELCQRVSREMTRLLFCKSYSLQVASAAVKKTDDVVGDFNKLYQLLDRVKNRTPLTMPLGLLPILDAEEGTGLPVFTRDKATGKGISYETAIKHRQLLSIPSGESGKGLHDYNDQLAYIHIDGNNMGVNISRVSQRFTDYRSNIKAMRQIGVNVNDQFYKILCMSEEWLKKRMVADGMPEEHFNRHYVSLAVGGDDVNCICASRYAMDFVEFFISHITQCCLWEDDVIGRIPFSVCAGIGYTDANTTFQQGQALAEQCCGTAKEAAKKPENMTDGCVGNWIDFQFCDGRLLGDVEKDRETRYVTDRGYHLCLRPYCLDDSHKLRPNHYSKLVNCMKTLREDIKDPEQRHLLMNAYSEGIPTALSMEALYEKITGKCIDNVGSPFVALNGGSGMTANWYDALELLNLVK